MSKDYLPHKIDPIKSAAHETKMHGHLKVKDMHRLVPSLCSNVGDVEVGLIFSRDERELCIVHGHLKTSIILQCQRCMEPFNYEIMTDFICAVINQEDAAQDLPDNYTPVLAAADGMLAIPEMIEDELIVDLPIVPMHDPKQCSVKLPIEAGEKIEVTNPFNVISMLRLKDDKKQ